MGDTSLIRTALLVALIAAAAAGRAPAAESHAGACASDSGIAISTR